MLAAVQRLYGKGGAAVAPIAVLCPNAAPKRRLLIVAALKAWIADDPAHCSTSRL